MLPLFFVVLVSLLTHETVCQDAITVPLVQANCSLLAGPLPLTNFTIITTDPIFYVAIGFNCTQALNIKCTPPNIPYVCTVDSWIGAGGLSLDHYLYFEFTFKDAYFNWQAFTSFNSDPCKSHFPQFTSKGGAWAYYPDRNPIMAAVADPNEYTKGEAVFLITLNPPVVDCCTIKFDGVNLLSSLTTTPN